MIKIDKSTLPEGITIKSENDYRTDPVFSMIKNDFHNKCYICELKEPTSINVEHFEAHKGNSKKKYDWMNLFFSCSHCNNTKLHGFVNMINCTKVDPEDYIELEMKPYPREEIKVIGLREDVATKETQELLNKVYNGDHTIIKKVECESLRNRVLKELMDFQEFMKGYYDPDENDLGIKQGFFIKIQKSIKKGASFAAFKRKIIRENNTYNSEFGRFL